MLKGVTMSLDNKVGIENFKLTNTLASFPDDRDFIYSPLAGDLPSFLDLKPDVFEVDDQKQIGSCTAQGATSACEFLLKKAGKGQSLSRLFTYYTTRVDIEGQPGKVGASTRDAVRSLYHFGVCPESMWPYIEGSEDIQPPKSVYEESLKHKCTRYERVHIGTQCEIKGTMYPYSSQSKCIENIKSALVEGLPVVFAMFLGKKFYEISNGDWRSHVYPPVSVSDKSNEMIGAHCMNIIGFDDVSERLLVENSWGPNWGDGGFVGIPYATFFNDAFEAWVIREFDGVVVKQPEQPSIPSDFSAAILDDAGKEITELNFNYIKGTNDNWAISPNMNLKISGGKAPYYIKWTSGIDADLTTFWFWTDNRIRHQFKDTDPDVFTSFVNVVIGDNSRKQNVAEKYIPIKITRVTPGSSSEPNNSSTKSSSNTVLIVGAIAAAVVVGIAIITKVLNLW